VKQDHAVHDDRIQALEAENADFEKQLAEANRQLAEARAATRTANTSQTSKATAAKRQQAAEANSLNIEAMYAVAKKMHEADPEKVITRKEMKDALAKESVVVSEYYFKKAWEQIPAGWKHPGGAH
ncbi:MAG: hypothetical protein J5556_00570, partial [Deltaproteobacteria bacterium]|nr:hypothetical protein [Deltaproteobacteria bacterium]